MTDQTDDSMSGQKAKRRTALAALRDELIADLKRRGLYGQLGAAPLGGTMQVTSAWSGSAAESLEAMRKLPDTPENFSLRMALREFRSACYWSSRSAADSDQKFLLTCSSCRDFLRQATTDPGKGG